MADQELQPGNIRPVAQPVSTFLQFQRENIPEPARPAGMPQGGGISTMQKQATPSVQGYNQAAQLAEALGPFSQKLTQVLSTGLEMYASSQYQQGMNEAARASLLLDRQMDASADGYAADNRKLAAVDPIAAMNMDTVNPYRAAGRQRKLSELAAFEVGPAIQKAYLDKAGDLAQLENNDPKLSAIRAQALQQVTQKYGLDSSRPGFMDLVLPKANQAWEQVQMRQLKDRQAYLKDTMPRTDGVQLLGLLTSTGVDSGTQLGWAGQMLTDGSRKLGLPGEATEYQRKAFDHAVALAVANGRPELVERLANVPVGPIQVGRDGKPFQATAAQMFGPDMFLQMDKFGSIIRKQKEEASKALGQTYENQLAETVLSLPEGPERAAAIQAVRQNGQFAGLGLAEKLKAEENINGLASKSQAMGDNNEGMTALLSNMQTRYGTAWNPKQADREFANALAQINSTDARERFRKEYQSVRRTQDGLSNSISAGPVDKAVSEAVKAALIENYPDMQTAAMAGNEKAMQAAMDGSAKTNAAAAAAKLSGAFRTEVYAKLGDAMAKKGGKLSNTEQQTIIQDTLKNYKANHKDTYSSLLPGVGSTPSISPLVPSVAGPDKPGAAAKPGVKPQTAARFNVDGLDNIPDREARLKNGGAVLNYKSTAEMLEKVLNNEQLPASVKRAAKDAGLTPEAFLLKQADSYPDNLAIPPQVRNQLIKQGNQRKALGDQAEGLRARPSQSDAIASAMNWLGNSLMGIAPASAATRYQAPDYMRQQLAGGWTARDARGQSIIEMATRNGWDPTHIAAIFSYETGGTLNPSEPGRGAAAGRVGLIQAGPNERLSYGLGTGNWAQEIKGVERYLKGRGAKPGMGMADLYSTVNGGNPKAGYTPDGNQVVPRSASTLKALEQHRQQVIAKLGLQASVNYGLPTNAGLQQFTRAKPVTPALITSHFGNHESFRKHAHEGADVGVNQGSRLGFKMGGTVLSVNPSRSTSSTANGGYGGFIDVRLDNGQIVRLAHLSEIPAGLAKGSKFSANQIIARSGGRVGQPGSGRSTGDHLHLEEHTIRQGLAETTRGKFNPNRPGGSLSYLIWE